MSQYTEDEVHQALEAIGNGKSLRQRFSVSQEAKLASWVRIQADLGLAPTHEQVREFAQRILNAIGDTKPLGKRWINAFIRRNPSVKVQRSRSIDSRRVNGASTEVIRD
ncbi:transposase [Colletotrichum musicola]|uniref:Transposase n=1 Tax=Colletotrichum musicola TaxID=2175873 RepID=A0A8H6NW17_9PEZI|nr:transposase [Colletotrichum musicola]